VAKPTESRLDSDIETVVLIDEVFRKCATYLLVNAPDPETSAVGRRLVGTAFFTTVRNSRGAEVIYAITAQHLLDKTEEFGPLFVRLSTTVGHEDFEAPQSAWTRHPSTDVAAIRVPVPPQPEFRSIGNDRLMTNGMVVEHRVGPGDELFFTGLFSEHPGRTRVEPIMRFGMLSMMPHEPIKVRDLRVASEIDAYLVEARSWGGHSGSPAFIYYPAYRSGNSISVPMELPVFLLGLVQSHYEIKSDVELTGDFLGRGMVPINAGIAAVVPSQKIIEVLMDDDLVKDRDN
jgi:hypothetical protein